MFQKTCKIKDATGGAASFAAWWIDLWNISMSKALKNVWSRLRNAFSVSLLDVYMYCYGDHVTIILITTLFESKCMDLALLRRLQIKPNNKKSDQIFGFRRERKTGIPMEKPLWAE